VTVSSGANVIPIHQVLHGYADGHRRLAQSRALSREADRVMLSLSDMSGPAMVPGFENYLTGYPLLVDSLYAFASTWYAPEMDRPGCVWTHTLLIEYADLARIGDLRTLLPLFVRPRGDSDLRQRYGHLVILRQPPSGTGGAMGLVNDPMEPVPCTVLAALYSTSGIPVFVPARSATAYQDVVLSLWSQQWPRLRRSFRFCTGALSNRTVDDVSFDLQVVPRERLTDVQRGARDGIAVGEACSEPNMEAAWVSCASDDLRMGSEGRLRQFLWRFAAEATVDRRVFKYLTRLFIDIGGTRAGRFPLDQLVSEVAAGMPYADQSLRFKRALFGQNGHGQHLLGPDVSEPAIIRALATTDRYQAFDAASLEICERAAMLWRTHRDVAEQLTIELAGNSPTPLGIAYLQGIVQGLVDRHSADRVARTWKVREALLDTDLSVAFSPDLWDCSATDKRRILTKIGRRQIADRDLRQIVAALLAANTDDIADDVFLAFGPRGARSVLDVIDGANHDPWAAVSAAWQKVLAAYPSELLQWLLDTPTACVTTIAFIAGVLNPHSSLLRTRDVTVWLRAADEAKAVLGGERYVDFMAFLLALGLINVDAGHEVDSSRELVVAAFQSVYAAVENGTLGARAWNVLEPVLPPPRSWWWERDDRPDRLRQAVLERFVDAGWPLRHFLACFEDPRTLRQAIHDCEATRRGRRLLRELDMYLGPGWRDQSYLPASISTDMTGKGT